MQSDNCLNNSSH